MSKSTPLSQLPSSLQGSHQNQNTFVNDHQKQMITQQQQAVNSISMPQNTQLPQDIINDDDATIQEVLNHISQQSGGQQAQQTIPQNMVQPLQQNIAQEPQGMSAYDNMMLQNIMAGGSAFGLDDIPHNQKTHGLTGVNTNALHSSNLNMFMNVFADDIKLAILVLVLVVAVNFVQIGSILGKYIAIEKIPYHDILLKAILVAVLVVIFKRVIIK